MIDQNMFVVVTLSSSILAILFLPPCNLPQLLAAFPELLPLLVQDMQQECCKKGGCTVWWFVADPEDLAATFTQSTALRAATRSLPAPDSAVPGNPMLPVPGVGERGPHQPRLEPVRGPAVDVVQRHLLVARYNVGSGRLTLAEPRTTLRSVVLNALVDVMDIYTQANPSDNTLRCTWQSYAGVAGLQRAMAAFAPTAAASTSPTTMRRIIGNVKSRGLRALVRSCPDHNVCYLCKVRRNVTPCDVYKVTLCFPLFY